MTAPDVASVRFDRDGLVPVVVQDGASSDVLMLAFMNDEALRLTRETGRAHYWSRSRSKLWRKGETSGNEQIVEAVRINCEQNSLLLIVEQIGAVCHEGFDTCYYRDLAEDDQLTVVKTRVFDPATVYGPTHTPETTADPFAEATRLQFGAYEFLRDNDLGGQSGTSRRLRDATAVEHARVADELEELAGVLNGTHSHRDSQGDLVLEASQVVYWVYLDVIRSGGNWSQLRPDRALATADGEDGPSRATIGRLLRAEAHRWRGALSTRQDRTAAAHATLALVGQACRAGGVEPLAVIEADLAELRSRSYLDSYFTVRAA